MISLVEMVAFLASLGKDGLLQVSTELEEYVLEFHEGMLTYATLRRAPDATELGEVLVEQGALTRLDLEEGLARSEPGEFLGESLMRQERITLEELRAALKAHALDVFARMHGVTSGYRFHFDENAQILERKDLRLGVPALLLESARLLDEERHNPQRSVAEGLEGLVAELEGVPAALPGATHEPVRPRPLEGVDAQEDVLRAALVQRLAKDELELPVLPDSTGQLLALLWAGDVETSAVLELVQRDQALSAYVLRTANSASLAPATPISDVQLAVTRLGLGKLREIAMALTLKQRVFEVDGWEDLVRLLWRRAALTSGFGSVVGKSCGVGAVRGGILGLLVDVGMPMVLGALQEIAKEHEIELTRPVVDRLMHEHHAAAGDLLARRWSLPEWVAAAIRYHEHYEDTTEFRLEAMVGNFAHQLALWAESPETIEAESLPTQPVFRDLGLEPPALRGMLANRARILELARLFR